MTNIYFIYFEISMDNCKLQIKTNKKRHSENIFFLCNLNIKITKIKQQPMKFN